MRGLIQRVAEARVEVGGEIVGAVGRGLLLFIGVGQGDSEADARWLAEKVADLRVFEDASGKLNSSVTQVSGAVLAVSQFTLYGDVRKGRRPSFSEAAAPDDAERLYDACVRALRARELAVETGRFGAHMRVSLVNDGPVTLWLDSRAE
jgi:D-tyrosyl-tRNA(Tyr) deacylase